MKTRMLAAAALLPVLLVILLAAPKFVVALIWGALLAMGAYEMLFRTGLVTEARLVIYACASAVLMTMWSYLEGGHAWLLLIVMLVMGLYFAEMMMSHVKITFDKVAMCLVAGLLVPLLLTSLIRILGMKIGRYVVLIPFVVAFMSDSGAYFAGMFFGKHKLAPVISPKKTVEGAIGGVVCAVVGMLIYCLILDLPLPKLNFRVNYLYAVIYGALGSVLGVFGDLCFSVLKRQTGIKDYGNLIPGHGGVLDRFDSMMLVGPLMEALLLLIPVVS